MKMFPKVSIVVLNYNGKDVIKKCLASLFKLDYPEYEVVVIDNASSDGSLEMAKASFSKATFIRNEKNLGFARGNNVGVRYALERTAEFVLLLNNDTEVERDFLKKMIKIASRDKQAGILSPVILDFNKKVWFAGGKISWWNMKTKHFQKIKKKEYYASDFITGCAMLIKAEVFKKVGLLDEDFFLYWEDADFSLRVRQAGFRNLVVSESRIYHYEKSQNTSENKVYWLIVSGLLFFSKHSPFWIKPWIAFYISLRKFKNFLDRHLRKKALSLRIYKAYQDFQNVRS